jgi:transglutaminase-like putative cysteine protease
MGAALICAILLSAAAESPFLRIFGSPGLRLVMTAVPAAAVAAAAARSWLARLARDSRSPLPAAGGFAAGLVAGGLPGMLLAAPDPFGPAALGPRLQQALTDGWYRLLSVPVPVPYTRSFTDLPFLLAATLAAVTVLTALGRHPAAAVLPATLGFGGLLILGVGGPMAATTLAGAFALAVLIFLVSVTPAAGRRAAVAAIVSGAALVAATVLVVGAVHPGQPYDPRSALRLPLNVTVSQDPLAMLSARLETPRTPVLTAQLAGSLVSYPSYWVLLTYDSYDGAGWLATGSAKPAVTAAAVAGTSGTGTARVTLAQPSALLPHPAYILGTDGEDLGYDPGAEMLASPSAISRYSVTVSVPEPSQTELIVAPLPSPVPAGLTATPSCVPALLQPLADEVRSEMSAPYEQAMQLEKILRSAPYRYDKAAAPGEGCGSLKNMLSSHKGTSAQFATTFALTARLLGIPARVAVGFSPGQAAGDDVTVTDADAYAWPQLEFYGAGWVNFDPTPQGGSSSQTQARQRPPASQKLKTRPPVSSPVINPTIAPSGPRSPGGLGVAARVLLGLAALIALVLAWMTAVWLWVRSRQRRRRRAVEPAKRALGAWDELLVTVRQAGTPIRGRSAPSVAADAAAIVPAEAYSVSQLATLVERALYDQITEREADTAWQLSDRARGPAAAVAGGRARLRRLFVPSSVGR